jgi:hypothetical protein
VAAYLSGCYWWPDDLGLAIDHAMGTPNGKHNDPRNVINEKGGLEDLGLVTLHKKRQGGRRELWSCTLTSKGEATVAAYCVTRGIKNPLAAALKPPGADVADTSPAPGPTRGPPPSNWSDVVSRDANAAATTYLFRFGKRNVWKIGHAQDISARLVEVNKHVPHEVLGERWSIDRRQDWPTQQKAYEMEQRLLTLLAARRTEGERVHCTEDELHVAWIGAIGD